MNGLFKQFGTDKEAEKKGVWVEYAASDDEKDAPAFLVARTGGANVSFSNAMTERMKPLQRRLTHDMVPQTELEKHQREVFVAHALKGWRNVKDEDGSTIEFSQANALALFEKIPDLYEDLFAQANRTTIFKLSNREAAAKN